MDYVNTMRKALEKMEDAIHNFDNNFDECITEIDEAIELVDSTITTMEDDDAIHSRIYSKHFDFGCRLSNLANHFFIGSDDLEAMCDMINSETDWLEESLS